MPDPITIGGLVAAALAAGAAEAGKGLLGGVAKDAYETLKSAASRLLGGATTMLVAKPESGDLAGAFAQVVEEQPAPVQAELHDLAEALRKALEAGGHGAAMSAALNQFTAGRDQYVAQSGGTINIGRRDPDG